PTEPAIVDKPGEPHRGIAAVWPPPNDPPQSFLIPSRWPSADSPSPPLQPEPLNHAPTIAANLPPGTKPEDFGA
ncbi:MAG TPA: hypothetical protein VIE65_21920, partial [Methylobacter sp.]